MINTDGNWDNGASSLYGGRPPANVVITDTFTVDEWRIMKDALIELAVQAEMNEKYAQTQVTAGCRGNGIAPEHYCDECKMNEHEGTQAALRVMKINELTMKIKV